MISMNSKKFAWFAYESDYDDNTPFNSAVIPTDIEEIFENITKNIYNSTEISTTQRKCYNAAYVMNKMCQNNKISVYFSDKTREEITFLFTNFEYLSGESAKTNIVFMEYILSVYNKTEKVVPMRGVVGTNFGNLAKKLQEEDNKIKQPIDDKVYEILGISDFSIKMSKLEQHFKTAATAGLLAHRMLEMGRQDESFFTLLNDMIEQNFSWSTVKWLKFLDSYEEYKEMPAQWIVKVI